MKPTDKNTYAFPLKEPLSNDELGMTLRDYFAAKVLNHTSGSPAERARWAYEVADAMIAERLK